MQYCHHRLEGDWHAKVEESWQGGRRREIVLNEAIAQQFLLGACLSNVNTLQQAGFLAGKNANDFAACARQRVMRSSLRHYSDATAGQQPGRHDETPVTTAAAGSGSPSAGASSAASRGAVAMTLGVISGQLKFGQATITARPGATIRSP